MYITLFFICPLIFVGTIYTIHLFFTPCLQNKIVILLQVITIYLLFLFKCWKKIMLSKLVTGAL